MSQMKLYFAPGTCSLSPQIVLHEAGLAYTPVQVSIKSHKLKDGGDFHAINPKGSVPVIELDDGSRLTEGPAIVQYIADQAPDRKLIPAAGTMERYRVQEWLNFITSELHKGYGPIFNPATPDEYKTMAKAKLGERYQWVDKQLEGKDYLMGKTFSVADAYLFTVTNWAKHIGLDLSAFGNLAAFMKRMSERPGVQAAMKAESGQT